ncbi:MAG: cytochrome-c peroxidase, partial [Flavobacteriia bacterium]|nr:cytochrome-c peroxidase [Flavobacteriia bacterium]
AGEPYYYGGERFPRTEQTMALGQKLFNDPNLSTDSTISCASCHKANAYFSDPGKALSVGLRGTPTQRNASALVNLAWHPYFFAEGGVRNLELSSFVPINNRHEFGRELHDVVEGLMDDPAYVQDFNKAFGSQPITDAQFITALAHYMAGLQHYDSPYDQWLSGDSTALGPDARMGLELFETHCASCHSGPQLSSFAIATNGLPTNADYGRMNLTNNPVDSGAFKIPTLRGIALTYPYMHDGSYADLDTVLRTYNYVRALGLTGEELAQLNAFLNTLH